MDFESIENTEVSWLKVCNDVLAANPGLDGAALFDAITVALPGAGVKVDVEVTASLRANHPNGVAVVDLGEGERDLIEFLHPGEFDIRQYTLGEDACDLISEVEAIDRFQLDEITVTAEDLAALRFVLRDGVKLYDIEDVFRLHDAKEQARTARFNEQRAVSFDLPNEFLLLCEQYGLTPVAALRGFVADVCGIDNYVANPREDGYSSNGSDERHMARAYFDRAHWSPEVEEDHGIPLTSYW
jgi:hypothetical protein